MTAVMAPNIAERNAPSVTVHQTFAHMWANAVLRGPDRTFLLFDCDGAVDAWTYDEFDQVVEHTAATLRRHGVSRGDCVHLALSNCPAFVAVWLAVSRLGAWMVAADPRATTDEISSQLARTSPVVGVVASSREDTYRAAVTETTLIYLLVVDEVASDVAPGSSLISPSDGHLSSTPKPAVGDRLAVMFTSGTTSAPKGVVLTQGLYAHTGAVMAAASRLSRDDRWLVALPLFHANAQYYCFASAISAGASVALIDRFSASRWVAQARRLQVTHASLFAAPIRMVLARNTAPQAAELKPIPFS